MRLEADRDYHLVLQNNAGHMIAQSPNQGCDMGATTALKAKIARARSLDRVCTRAKVTGVAFWDFNHGQTGVAPNAIELHPILGFHRLAA